MKKHKIIGIKEESIAEELEIEAGDYLIAINGSEIEDIFDYHYLAEDEKLEVIIEKADGEEWLLDVEKDEDEDLGLIFGQSLMDSYRSCFNKCVFCFIDQNPKGMRESIYFKDDDTRLSFLQGNYVTLTNMKESDIERIIKYKLAPINISVHTTNPDLRCKMLNNRFAGKLKDYMDMLYEAHVPMNAQIVLCKGINDNAELEKTISDLINYVPVLESLSIVPVGLTAYRDGLCKLESFNATDARKVIKSVEKYQKIAYEKHGTHFVHASDEWYINAGEKFPDEDNYDGYTQLENGVGMSRLLINEVKESVDAFLEERDGRQSESAISLSAVSGVLAENIMLDVVSDIKRAFPKLSLPVYAIKNDFFGEKITVTGLLTGGDIAKQLKGKELGSALLLPCNTLKADEDIFLDDMTVSELQNALQVPVIIVQSSGMDFFDKIKEFEISEMEN